MPRLIPRFLRRWWHGRRVAHWQHHLAALEATKRAIDPSIDHARRELGNARTDLAFVDIARPPISRAPGRPRGEGMVRAISQAPEPFTPWARSR